jgi:prepilin peptidase CpaA
VQLGVCVAVGLAATIEDLWRRRISNWTVLAGFAGGLVAQVSSWGWRSGGLGWLAGAAVGFAVFLVFFLAGGMGGGDIKLLAALGSCVGPKQLLWAALWTAFLGALEACGYLCWDWRRRRRAGPAVPGDGGEPSIPYAPAIFAGVLLSFLSS